MWSTHYGSISGESCMCSMCFLKIVHFLLDRCKSDICTWDQTCLKLPSFFFYKIIVFINNLFTGMSLAKGDTLRLKIQWINVCFLKIWLITSNKILDFIVKGILFVLAVFITLLCYEFYTINNVWLTKGQFFLNNEV